MISFKEFQEFDFRVGEVISVDGSAINLNVGKDILVRADLDVKEGDKVVVLVNGEEPAILSAGRKTVGVDGEAEVGMRVS